MADDERPAVGTVAQEAARLLDALGGWASSTQAGYAAGPAPEPASQDDDADDDADGADGAHDSASAAGGRDGSGRDGAGHGHRCESCGAENGAGQALTCQLCPVCQGISLLRSVRPETVDRLADLAGALAATLRDIAGQRRDAGGAGSGPSPTRKPSSQAARGRVQDITVDDEDEDHDSEHPGSATS